MNLLNRKRKMVKGVKGYLLWALISIELLMSFSFLGYIHIRPISLTLVYIPVLLAGCLIGPWEATLVGVVFGLASMWKASAFYISSGDMLFSPVMSGKPFSSVLLSVGARALFGLVSGILYWIAKRSRHPWTGVFLVSSFGRLIHSFIVYTFMGLLFPEQGYTALSTFDNALKWESIVFLLVQDMVVLSCYRLQYLEWIQQFGRRIQTADRMELGIVHNRKMVAAGIGLTFISSFSVAWYFINRIGSVMAWHGVVMANEISYDIVHLQTQFLMGILSLFSLAILVLVLYLKNFNYLYYEAKLDGLTGLISRGQFFLLGEKLLANREKESVGKNGYFIILDIDQFKEINDRHGHPVGDRVLSEVADCLRAVMKNIGVIGRLGGDEFVVLIHQPIEEEKIRALLNHLKEEIVKIHVRDLNVTCSVGVVTVKEESTIEGLYKKADGLLYEAKKNGKNQFIFEQEKSNGL